MQLLAAVLAVGFAGLIGSLWVRPEPGRYQLVARGDALHRLDTATGDMQAFVLEGSEPSALGVLHYWPLAAAEGGAPSNWTLQVVADAIAKETAETEAAATAARASQECRNLALKERRRELEAKIEATRLRRGDPPLSPKEKELFLWIEAHAECDRPR